ncbi:hypothetical protein [Gemmata sp.]|uniref:hypothetical protein n=1 Tax=Gemmata sp. TaxID=1914242 RepID=UPI003F6FCED6
MSGRYAVIGGVLGLLLTGPGCVTCCTSGCRPAHEAGPDCDALTCQRNRVYVFAMCGVNPVEIAATDTFRANLNQKGFIKVGTGQPLHAAWMETEIRRVCEEEPNNRVVLVGIEGGAATTAKLAEKLNAAGAPLAAVVYFDRRVERTGPGGCRVLSVAGHGASAAESAAAVAQLLNEVAATTGSTTTIEVVSDYPHAPLPRPTIDPGTNPEWAFLFDGGIPARIGSAPLAAKPAPRPTTTTATAANR